MYFQTDAYVYLIHPSHPYLSFVRSLCARFTHINLCLVLLVRLQLLETFFIHRNEIVNQTVLFCFLVFVLDHIVILY